MPDDAHQFVSAPSAFAYRAFISYSHRDKAFAMRLHRRLENYRIPAKLVGTRTAVGVVPRRLTPIFRDREELPASPDLGGELSGAIRGSMFLVVICSPGAAKSHWVEQEILQFKRTHGDGRVLALIIGGTPGAHATPGREDEECFPRTLRYRLGADGELSDVPAEPIAADLRKHADGERLAQLKLIAGLTGLKLDQLVQREAQRRLQQMTAVAAGALGGMVVTGGLAVYANDQRIEANAQRIVAEKEARAARAASDYLVATFEVSNPATENPRTITALTILGRSAERARTELAGEPAIQARLLATLGRAYNGLGLLKEAQGAIEPSLTAVRRAGPDGAEGLITLAETYLRQGALDQAMRAVKESEQLLGPDLKAHQRQRGLAAVMRGRIHRLRSEVDLGLAAFRQAQAYLEADRDTPPDVLARVYTQQGLLLSDAGRFTEADVSLAKALSVRQRTVGPEHFRTGAAWLARAQNSYLAATSATPFNEARLREAEIQVANAIRIQRRVLEPENPNLATTLAMQGQILVDQGKMAQAEPVLREVIANYRKAYDGPHVNIGFAELYLAQIEADRGQTSAALATLADAKHNYDVGYGKTHPNHGELLVQRAKVLAKAGRMAEAREDCAAGMKILTGMLGAEASFTRTNAAKCAALAPPSGLHAAALKAGKGGR